LNCTAGRPLRFAVSSLPKSFSVLLPVVVYSDSVDIKSCRLLGPSNIGASHNGQSTSLPLLGFAVVRVAVGAAVDVDDQGAAYRGPVPVDVEHSADRVDVERYVVRSHPVSVDFVAWQTLDTDELS
jgi:hypothetical protein